MKTLVFGVNGCIIYNDKNPFHFQYFLFEFDEIDSNYIVMNSKRKEEKNFCWKKSLIRCIISNIFILTLLLENFCQWVQFSSVYIHVTSKTFSVSQPLRLHNGIIVQNVKLMCNEKRGCYPFLHIFTYELVSCSICEGKILILFCSFCRFSSMLSLDTSKFFPSII